MELNEIFGFILSYGIPIGILFIALIMIAVLTGVAVSWTRYITLAIIVIMLLIPSASSYGTLDGENAASSIFWTKGSKSFFFSFLDMAIFGTWLFGVVIVSGLSRKSGSYTSPLAKWYLAFGLLFLGYIVVALFGKHSLLFEFENMGVINVLKQGMFISLLFATVRTEQDIVFLIRIIIYCLVARETWGLFRYVFLGGDPQNIYANTYADLSGLKLTFFDINDHILASLTLGYSTWKLLVDRVVGREKLVYAIIALMALLIPALSARRTAQGGLLLAIILLFFLLPRGRRSPILILLALVIPLSFASLSLRSGDNNKSASEKVLIDIQTGEKASDPRTTRFYELQTAWNTVKEEPFFGVGPSGQFKVTSPIGLEYHKGNYGFVHSGFGHILLKTGFVGLFIFIGIFLTYVINVKKGWRLLLPEYKALAVGCLCGFAAQMPNMFTGPPVIEVRTMLLSGFLFAIPLICIEIARRKIKKNQGDEIKLANESVAFAHTIPSVKLRKNK